MNKSYKIILPLLASVILVVGFLMGYFINKKTNVNPYSELGEYGQKLTDIIHIIDMQYVDTVDKKKLFEKTISNLLHELDPHSNYISAEDLAEYNESIQGQFGGIGIRFTIYDDTLNVVNVIDNSPSYRVGIQKFDQIVVVEGDTIANVGLSNDEVRKLLKGAEGTPVNVTLMRNGEMMNKKIIRGAVPIESVNAYYMVDSEIGYIQLSQFSIQSDQEFYKAALELKNQGMKKLIFDLRYNGGGVLGTAVRILETMLERGTPIVSTKGKNQPEEIIYAEGNPFLKDIEIVVLINSSSASASEIVAGAIQDNDRGTIVGRRSFGKGLVQQDIPLRDGSDLRLTISRYYTPTGRSIQKPYSGTYDDYIMEEYHRYDEGELYALDSSLMVDSLKFVTPKGKIVYGGGGIMPDIFVPLDTAGSSFYYRSLQFANAFNEFSYYWVRFNSLDNYRTFRDFDQRFVVTQTIMNDFIAFSEKRYNIRKDEKGFARSEQLIKTKLKAEIARQKWLETGAYYIVNQTDVEFQIALEVLKGKR